MHITRRRLFESAGALLGLGLSACAGRAARRAGAGTGTDIERFLGAVERGDTAAVRGMLAETPALARAVDAHGRSAFVLAHLAQRHEVAAVLRETGIELDVVEAVLAEDWALLAELAADDPAAMNAAHPIGGTPLYAGALVGGTELYRLRSLRCDPEARPAGGSGFTPARGAMECRDALGAYLAAAELLGNRSDPNAAQRDGDSVLHGAVRRRDERLVRLVVRKGGDVEACDARGRTPRALAEELGWEEGEALLRGHAAIARDHRASRFAFDASRNPVVVPDLSDVPLDLQDAVTGSSHARLPELRELVGTDARLVFSVSSDGELAIEACGHTGNREIIGYHLDHGAPLSLPTAVSLGDVAHARFLLEGDPLLINERGPHDFALMWYPAIGRGSVELAELLLSFGTPVDQESLGNTGLHWAALRGDVELVRYLIGRGADIDALGYKFDRAGQTPLALAKQRGREDVVGALRELGAREA